MFDIGDCELRLEYNINIASHTNTYSVWYSNKLVGFMQIFILLHLNATPITDFCVV